jgi:CPA2 family monovalent cation:H+ antiporter-2
VGVAVLAVSAILLASLRFGGHLSRLLSSPNDEVLLLRLLGVTLLVAGVAQQTQVSAAVGAFLVGIALSGEVAEGARTLLTPLRDLFAAVFFVFFGLQTDPGAIPAVALVALALGLVTTATKLATGWYAAGRAGVAARGRVRAGAALVARGEFSIVIAGLAVSAGGRAGARAARRRLRAAAGGDRPVPGALRRACLRPAHPAAGPARVSRRCASRRRDRPNRPGQGTSPASGEAGLAAPTQRRAGAPAPAAPLQG